MRRDYDAKRVPTRYDLTDPTTYYIGYAEYNGPSGAPTTPATSDSVWTIKRITLTGGLPVRTAWTPAGVAVWDNRTTESYQ